MEFKFISIECCYNCVPTKKKHDIVYYSYYFLHNHTTSLFAFETQSK